MADWGRFNAQKGRRSIWLRQNGDTGEGDYARIRTTLIDYGYQALAPKVADGVNWQAGNDPTGQTEFASFEAVEVIRDTFAASGLALIPVVVPRYWRVGDPDEPQYAPADPEAQAHMHGRIARICGTLITDLEPYTGFWSHRTDLIPTYTRALRAAAGNAYLINQPDPRQWGMAGARVVETAGDFDGLMCQHYVGWSAGGVNWTNVEEEIASLGRIAALGRDLFVTLYGVDRTDLALAFYERAITRFPIRGANLFALGPMNAANLTTFGQIGFAFAPDPIPGTVPPAPEPTPPAPVPTPDRLDAVIAEVLQWARDDQDEAERRRQLRAERLLAIKTGENAP